MKKKIIIGLAIVLGLIAIRFIFSASMQLMMAKGMKAGAVPTVTVGTITDEEVLMQREAPARVLSDRRVDVVARIDGYLTKSYFKEGDFVKKGQVLFEIEPQQWLYDLQQAKANVDNTKAQLVYAEKQVQRSAILVKKDYISKANYDEVISNRDSLRGQLKMFQAQVSDAQRKYGYTKVKAPVSGRVGMIDITVGNYVTSATGPMTTIYSVDPIYVTFPLAAKEYFELQKIDKKSTDKLNRKVDFYLSSGEKYQYSGHQDYQDNVVDESSGTILLRAVFKNPDGILLNGDIGKAVIYSDTKVRVPLAPQTAVMENPQGKYVYTLDSEGLPVISYIKTSGQSGIYWIVTEGLKKGDKILTGGLQKVIPNKPVKIVDNIESVNANKDASENKEDNKK